MKKTVILTFLVSSFLLLNSCSSVKVLDFWKSDNIAAVKDNNILVIARTTDTGTRATFENEIVKQLQEKGINATASFTKFPKLKPNEKLTPERQEEIKEIIKSKGFNGVVLTVVKNKQKFTKTIIEGGYDVGASYGGYYPQYYAGFYGYYYNPMSYSTHGTYVPESSKTYTSANYILETLVYDLEQDIENQLVAVVTSKIEEPDNADIAAKQYVKAIAKSFK